MTEKRPDPIPQPVLEAEPAGEDPSTPENRPPSRLLSRTSIAWLALLLLLGAATVIAPGARSNILALANPDVASGERAAGRPGRACRISRWCWWRMDADLGTYPEIRPAIRAALDDLLATRSVARLREHHQPKGARSPPPRWSACERRASRRTSLLDIGFVAGVEAGMVRLVGVVRAPQRSAVPWPMRVRSRGGGLDAFDMALLVGGSDVGPRTWVEQVGTRVPRPADGRHRADVRPAGAGALPAHRPAVGAAGDRARRRGVQRGRRRRTLPHRRPSATGRRARWPCWQA